MDYICEKARLILKDMGKNIFHAGPRVAKACNNMLLAIHMIGTCEAMEIAGLCEVDNAMGQLARELYSQHQQGGSGQRDFSSILRKLQA